LSGTLISHADVVVAGDIFVDLILGGFTAWPGPGTEVFAKDYRREVGGGAAITACGLARLGSRTSVLAVVGRDTGDWVSQRLVSSGVEVGLLRFDEAEPTAVSVGVTTAQDRTFLTYQGANSGFPAALAEAAKDGSLAGIRHLHLGWAPSPDSADEWLAAIQQNGCTVSLDTGWHEDWLSDPRTSKLLRQIDVFFPNESEAARMTGERDVEKILAFYDRTGVRRVALKRGREGAALLWDGEILQAPALHVVAVDTIGAGDCFNAGFLHYWLQGESPLSCLQRANICGAASTEGYGGLETFPDTQRIEREMKGLNMGKNPI
jgi:sugar/nucleoside kinase (ribokinase family)